MKKIYIFCLSLVIFNTAALNAFAGWPIGKYRSIVVPSFNYYTSKDVFDGGGKRVKGASGSGFTSYAYGLYFGYGLSRRTDLIVNVLAPFQNSKFVNTAGTVIPQQSSGFGDLQVGLSYNLKNYDYKRYLSMQVSAILPLYNNDNNAIALGYGRVGAEAKLMYTGSFTENFLRGCFYNLEGGYRRFFDAQGPDVIVYSASLGVPVDRRNQVSFEVGGQRASSSNKSFSQNLSINRDFAFTKSSVSLGHTFSRRFSLFGSGFYTFAGRNSGVGYGGALQAVIKI
jgi:hypothetical protein